jgi:TRAP transporter TAXI family solute receptor
MTQSEKKGTMALRGFLRNKWPVVAIALTAATIVIAVIVMLRTMPPRMIVMATGAAGGAYSEVGERYRAVLARAGVEVRLVSTAGSPENLALLLDPRSGVSVSLIEGGTTGTEAPSRLESLGTVFYEPLWLFHKRGLRNTGLSSDLRGRRISIGPLGSGTRALSLELLKRNEIDGQVSELLALGPQAAGDALLAGKIDAAFILSAWEAPVVQKLLAAEQIELATFPRADAYVALFPFLNKVVVPRGIGDLAKDLPPNDVILVAPKASLVVNKDLHPAIQYLLLNAAMQIHSRQSVFHQANQFPAAEAIDIPLSSEALQFYKSGRPYLHNYLPFWAADLFGKLIVLLIPILGVLYPILRFLPPLYDWLMRSKIARIYGELRFLEDEIIEAHRNGGDLGAMAARLDHLEEQANQLRIPLAYASMLYILRNHIDIVRERLQN